LSIGVFRKANSSGLGNALQSSGDVDAIAHEIAIALLDHIANVDANAKLNAPLRREASVSLDHSVLNFDGAAHGVNYAAKLNDASVASALNYTPMMHGYCRVNQVATERAQPRQCPILV
jgi:hypothetical protein